MKQNLRIVREGETLTVAPDGGDWMLCVDENGASLHRLVIGSDSPDGSDAVEGWMDETLAKALDEDDHAMIDAYMARHPELKMQPE